MKRNRINLFYIVLVCLILHNACMFSQSKGLKSITEQELRQHLEFIAASEIMGRPVPSQELEIVTLYLANWAKYAGLKPLLNDGSFYQHIPITVSSVSMTGTKLRVSKRGNESLFYYGKTFGLNFPINSSLSGNVVFAGFGLSDPENGWDDLKDLDLKDKVAVILDEKIPDNLVPEGKGNLYRLPSRISNILSHGATAVLTVINPSREEKLEKGREIFGNSPVGRMIPSFDSQKSFFGTLTDKARPPLTKPSSTPKILQAEIAHDIAAEILGVSKAEIIDMFNRIKEGKQLSTKDLPGVMVRLDFEIETYESTTRNVIGVIEGSDAKLKDEYIIICAHHDHLGVRNGEIIAGADDNGSGTVALMEIANALLIERPKRSIIIAWFTAEERGLQGSQYFINNCPVPVEMISACLNLDMVSRNPVDSLFLVAPDLLSSGLDGAINKVNKKFGINFGFDYKYSNLTHPQRVYYRSDHYPFIRFGIPSVWFFGGFHPDYHTPRDVLKMVDYRKLYRSTMLVYLTAYEVGNQKELLKLDVNKTVTSRGKHNVTNNSLY